MDPNTYETVTLQRGSARGREGLSGRKPAVEVLSTEGSPVQVDLPASVQLKVIEAPEGLRGDTAAM